MEGQARPGECRLLPAQVMQSVEVAEAARNLLRSDKLKADLAVNRKPAAQIPDAAAGRLSQSAQICGKAATQIRLVAHQRVKVTEIMPPRPVTSGKCLVPLFAGDREADYAFGPCRLLQQDADTGVPHGVDFPRGGDHVEIFRDQRPRIPP